MPLFNKAFRYSSSTTVTPSSSSVTTLSQITTMSSLTSVGTITTGTWSGLFGAVSGANLTTLNASNLASGTVPDARISGSYTGMTNLTGTGTVDFALFLGNAADTASAPSFSWTSDTNTGMFRAAADTIGLTTAGTERLRITSSGDLGIGVTPTTRLHVVDAAVANVGTTPGTAASALFTFTGTTGGTTTIATTGVGGAGSPTTISTGTGGVASSALTSSTGGRSGAMTLSTATAGAAAVAGTGSNTGGQGGAFNITGGAGGAATGDTTGDNTGGAGAPMTIRSGAGGAASNANATPGVIQGGDGGLLLLIAGVGGAGTGGTAGSGGDIRFQTATTTTLANRMAIKNDGSVGIGTVTPNSLLDVASSTGSIFTLTRVDTSVTANDSIGTIQFYANDTSTTTNQIAANIEVQATNTISTDINPGRMIFRTTPTTVAATPTEALRITQTQSVTAMSATGGLGYGTGAGGTVTQITSRTTGVTVNTVCGAITLVSAAGSSSWQSFTVTNSTVAATDTIIVNQKSGTDLYMINVTAVAAGSFRITYATTGGTTTEQPVFNFAIIKAVTS